MSFRFEVFPIVMRTVAVMDEIVISRVVVVIGIGMVIIRVGTFVRTVLYGGRRVIVMVVSDTGVTVISGVPCRYKRYCEPCVGVAVEGGVQEGRFDPVDGDSVCLSFLGNCEIFPGFVQDHVRSQILRLKTSLGIVPDENVSACV